MKVTKPIVQSVVFEFAKLLTAVLFYSLLARTVTPAVFGGYVLIRKVAAWFCPIASFGTYVGLSYYLPAASDERQKREIISASALFVVVVILCFVVLLAIFPDVALDLFFGERKAGSWLGPLVAMVAVDALYQYIIAVKRGNLNITAVNVYKLIIVGIIPLAAILIYPKADLRRLVFIIAIASMVVLSVPVFGIFTRWIMNSSLRDVLHGVKCIWKYHASRVPGDLLFMTFIGCWLVIAAHLYDYNSVGYVSVGLNMIGALGIITVPFETVLLPVTRRLQSIGTKAISSDLVFNALQCSIQIALYVSIHVAALAPFIIRWWLGGGEYANAAQYVRLMSPMLFGYILYVGNRHIADGISTRPINAYLVASAITVSISMFATGYYIFGITSLNWLCISCSIGFVLLGMSLLFYLIRHYGISFKVRDIVISVLYSMISAIMIIMVRRIDLSPYGSFAVVSSLEMILFFVYTYLLGKTGAVWARKITRFIFSLVPTIKKGFADKRISSLPPGR